MKTIMMKTTGWLVMAAARMEGKAMTAAARTRQALTLMAAAAVMGLATASCSSEDGLAEEPVQQPAENTDAVKKYTMTVNVSKGDGAATRALSLSGSTLNATWDAGEEVLVYQNGSKIGTLTAAASSTASTTLSGTLDSAPDADQALTFYFHTAADPSYDGQDGTLTKIASSYDFCAPAEVATGNFTVDAGNRTVSVPAGISFGANKQAIVKFTFKDKADNATISPSEIITSVDIASSVNPTGKSVIQTAAASVGVTFPYESDITIPDATYDENGAGIIYLAIPDKLGGGIINYNSKLDFTLTATVGSDTYTLTKSGFPFSNGKYYEITAKMTRQPRTYDLSQASSYTANGYGVYVLQAQDGDVLTGTFVDDDNNRYIQIADGATVTLRDATIHNSWAIGLYPLGDATIILEGENTVSSGEGIPGINAAYNFDDSSPYTLTIKGSGSLTATGGEGEYGGPGIGTSRGDACGNIVIEGGTIIANGGTGSPGIGGGVIMWDVPKYGDITINGGNVTATGGAGAAGIGSGTAYDLLDITTCCGNITINGGNVTATGGAGAAGIGGGTKEGDFTTCCGDITISSPATVKATKGTGAPYSIGPGDGGRCTKVYIYGDFYWIESDSYYETGFLGQSPLVIKPWE